MDIPRDNRDFLPWAATLTHDELVHLEIELDRRITSTTLQLRDTEYTVHDSEWHKRAQLSLDFNKWRLSATQKLLAQHDTAFASKFVSAAKRLLDVDTFGVLSQEASK
jgi:hypothetical protein